MAHLDIKLENIVMSENFLVKLIDFAYCEHVGKKLNISKGTERYFAPEVAKIFYERHARHPDSLREKPFYIAEKADVFSLGILLFTMIFGQPPFYQNVPDKSQLLPYLCSGHLETAEVFF
jgi:serine/threonine protein kinase